MQFSIHEVVVRTLSHHTVEGETFCCRHQTLVGVYCSLPRFRAVVFQGKGKGKVVPVLN
jgi:hypothetical protein